MTKRLVVLLVLLGLAAGCGSSSRKSDLRERAEICARSWEAKGFTFDPNTMTCEEMYERAQAIRKAAYWKERGYTFDPNTMTVKEMDRRASDLRTMGVREYPPASGAARGDEAGGTSSQPAVRPADLRTRRMLQKMTIFEVRAKYPMYNDMDDMELTRGIHDRYFADMPFQDFARRFLGYEVQ